MHRVSSHTQIGPVRLNCLQLFDCATGEVAPSSASPSPHIALPGALSLSNLGVAVSVCVPLVNQKKKQIERDRIVQIWNLKSRACKDLPVVVGLPVRF